MKFLASAWSFTRAPTGGNGTGQNFDFEKNVASTRSPVSFTASTTLMTSVMTSPARREPYARSLVDAVVPMRSVGSGV
jgi:hypothetical protein